MQRVTVDDDDVVHAVVVRFICERKGDFRQNVGARRGKGGRRGLKRSVNATDMSA